jgi:cytochrome c553
MAWCGLGTRYWTASKTFIARWLETRPPPSSFTARAIRNALGGWKMRIFGWAALTAVCALACGADSLAQSPAAGGAQIKRGEYLVTGIAGCNDCHTPMTPQGPDMTHSLQGGPLGFAPTAPMPWAATAPPIAGGPAGYTEAQFVAFLQTGVRPDGSRPLPPMPAYRMNEADARAVAAYVRSVAPAR